ncbi:MAG: restriction endonuclease subunit S [Pseudonocardiales bacterium]|nr:restriction endonuclease subunit S [Pseudonocardiales bacterium]
MIADFLDVETARIDALIAKKSRLEVAITARVLASIESVIWAPKYSRIPLRRVCRFIDYRGATPSKSNSGVSLITASHIRDGWLDLENEPQWVDESTYKEWMRRGWPAVGDVLLTTEAPLGNVAQITDSRVALAQRVILLKPNESVILADFLPLALRSLTFQNMLSAYATGSTALGIKADRLKALNVPVPPLVVQLAHVNEIMRQESAANRARSALMAQISLLRQRKQALITAAVTGEMDVPGVSA